MPKCKSGLDGYSKSSTVAMRFRSQLSRQGGFARTAEAHWLGVGNVFTKHWPKMSEAWRNQVLRAYDRRHGRYALKTILEFEKKHPHLSRSDIAYQMIEKCLQHSELWQMRRAEVAVESVSKLTTGTPNNSQMLNQRAHACFPTRRRTVGKTNGSWLNKEF